MSLLQYRFHSKTIRMDTEVCVILPENEDAGHRTYPVLYLLHGAGGDCGSWLRYTSVERYAEENKIAVVMPSAYNSCYADMVNGIPYFTFMSEELPSRIERIFPVAEDASRRFVAGLSMGGRGAFLWALRKPDFFRGAVCLSGSLDVSLMAERMKREKDEMSLKRFSNAFGNLESLSPENDVWALTKKLASEKRQKPDFLYMCGTEDVRYKEQMLPYLSFCEKHHFRIGSMTDHGVHDYAFWDPAIRQAMKWMKEHV